MGFSKGRNSINLEDILSKVEESDILYFYLGVSKIPIIINSPLRKDKKPSFGLYSIDGKKIFYTDLSTKDKGNLFSLLSKMWGCGYKETLEKISKDISKFTLKSTTKNALTSKITTIKSYNIESDLQCKIRKWENHDLEYWKSYGISLDWLKYAEVYPISHKIIIKKNNTYTFKADKYAYAYVERKEGKITLKIYQPFNKNGYKWSNKHDTSVISLWTKVPKTSNSICICSSLKDALCIWANTKIPSICVQGEGYNISNTAIIDLKERFKHIYIVFDGDNAGKESSIKLQKITNFKIIDCPLIGLAKDWSDIYYYFGKDRLIEEFSKSLKNSH